MKVLWFANSPANATEYLIGDPIGGGWLVSLDKLLQREVELHVAFYFPKSNSSFKYFNTTYHPIGKRFWHIQALFKIIWRQFTDKQDISRYLEIITLVNPDIIHINGTENPFGCIIGRTTVPVVTSIQGIITVYQHKYFSGIESKYLSTKKIINTNFKELLFGINYLKEYKSFIKSHEREERNLKNSKFVIGRTDWDKRIMTVLAPNSKYFHVDEILREPFYSSKWSKSEEKELFVVHTTTGHSYYKGVETICLAHNILTTLEIKVEWRIAGIESNDLIIKVIRNKLKKKFPNSGLVFYGALKVNQLVSKLLDADVYVMPSHIENSPNNLCEAMIIGMPCIATFVGGTGSLLKDGVEGILIQDGDPWAMAGAIIELLSNPAKAVKYGEMARKRALKRHNPKKIINTLLNTYKAILNDPYHK
jgi:glycosyltransferase involved in cell wall biosynthesis